jgi:hypothetical protein
MIHEGKGFNEEKGRTKEELHEFAFKNYVQTERDKLEYDKRDLKDKFTDSNYLYGSIVNSIVNKAAKFDEYNEDRNRAQDAGLTIEEKRVNESFNLPEGWVKEVSDGKDDIAVQALVYLQHSSFKKVRYYNENLDLYSYRLGMMKIGSPTHTYTHQTNKRKNKN